jgi:hypothetical protein
MLRALINSHALRSPSELLEAVEAPADIIAAFATGRPELLNMSRHEPMDAEGVARLYKLIRVLIETNFALQAHAREVSALAASLNQQITGAIGSTLRLREFASFTVGTEEDEPD